MSFTQHSIHLNDLLFKLNRKVAKNYGSEGQQRNLVLALKLAQATYFLNKSGLYPIILADDVLGQLDMGRRKGFWQLVENASQIIATGTKQPAIETSRHCEAFLVNEGSFQKDFAKEPLKA